MIERIKAVYRMFFFRAAASMVIVMGLAAFIVYGQDASLMDVLRQIAAVFLGAWCMVVPYWWSRSDDVPKN